MKKISLIILICIAFSMLSVYSQEDAVKGKKQEKIPLYGLRISHKSGTFFTYKVNEVTHVRRIYPDESTKDYSREITYYLTARIPSSPEDGFQTLVVVIDSLTYKFQEGEAVIEFSSMDMSGKALTFKDLDCRTGSMGREFNMVYSPYGEVAAIKGVEIDETLNYVNEKGEGYLSETETYKWFNVLSKEHLDYIADFKKIILPEEKVAMDSIWKSPVSTELNGYNFYDTLALRLVNYNAGTYTVIGESQKLKPYDKDSFSYNISNLVNVAGVTGKGNWTFQLKATGRMESSESNYDVTAKIQVGEQYVIEQIKSNVKWQFINIFKL